MYVCMYVCMHICTYPCVCVCVCVCDDDVCDNHIEHDCYGLLCMQLTVD